MNKSTGLRGDGLPWFFDCVMAAPNEGNRKHSNYNIDSFGVFVATMAWMHQGRFKFVTEADKTILQLPYVVGRLEEGHTLTNWRTGTIYTITEVQHNYRDQTYSEPILENVEESRLIPERVWRNGFHPDELTGYTVKVSSDVMDLDPNKGDFFDLQTEARITFRQAFAGTRPGLSTGSDYKLKYKVDRSEPSAGKSFFARPRQARPKMRDVDIATHDPGVVAKVSAVTYDSLVRFEIEAKNAFELNLLTNWFEVFMERHIPVLERVGFSRVQYWDRLEVNDPNKETAGSGDDRRVRYAVRSERIWPGREPILRQVDLTVTKNKP